MLVGDKVVITCKDAELSMYESMAEKMGFKNWQPLSANNYEIVRIVAIEKCEVQNRLVFGVERVTSEELLFPKEGLSEIDILFPGIL